MADAKDCEFTLITEACMPVDVAQIGKHKWPYVDIGLHIEGLAEKAKDMGRHVVCINVDYLGTKDVHGYLVHCARATAYLTKGLCGHKNIKDCIETLEKWRVGPYYPRLDFHEATIVDLTKKMKGL